MKLMLGLAVALSTALAVAATLATSIAVIGDERITLVTPTRFVDASPRAPEIWKEALRFQATGTRLLEYYMTSSDYQKSLEKQEGDYAEYMMVQTPIKAESITATQALFDRLGRVNTIVDGC